VRPGEYVGVVAGQVYHMRQGSGDGAAEGSDGGCVDDVFFRRLPLVPPPGGSAGAAACSDSEAMAALREYFTLDTRLTDLCVAHCSLPPYTRSRRSHGGHRHAHFASVDPRFAALLPYVSGARLLRQPPVECLFAFICSSNNNVKRIAGMVDRLCVAYGTQLGTDGWGHSHWAFPTLQQLASADEARLRDLGFGYRAKFITGAAQQLLARPGGGQAWLEGLRGAGVPSAEAVRQLAALPGVGPKVAACAALFSLDKHDCIPVDTHVWQFACAHYPDAMLLLPPSAPRRKKEKAAAEPVSGGDAAATDSVETPAGPACTLRTMGAVATYLQQLWGPYAGWAHTACFIVELADQKGALPAELRTPKAVTPAKAKKGTKRPAAAAGGRHGRRGVRPSGSETR
jgi:N-glycosylase/DNA lyase